MSKAQETIAEARNVRTAGDAAGAERLYRLGAELARAEDDTILRAHALRHISDLARECGDFTLALSQAEEAVALYRTAADARPLDLANALRLTALALEGLNSPHAAVPAWQEARRLYVQLGVQAGVDECDRHLAG